MVSSVSGATHFHFRQTFEGIPVYHGQLRISVNRDGRVISVSNAFFPDLAAAAKSQRSVMGARQAVAGAAQHLGFDQVAAAMEVGSAQVGAAHVGSVGAWELDPAEDLPAAKVRRRRATRVKEPRLSEREIAAELAWLPIHRGEVRLVWVLDVDPPGDDEHFEMTVDAADGKVLTRFNKVRKAQYRVYPLPVKSPHHTTPLPPADGRLLVVDPQDSTASPNGWHSTGSQSFTTLRGNNATTANGSGCQLRGVFGLRLHHRPIGTATGVGGRFRDPGLLSGQPFPRHPLPLRIQ